MKFTSRIIDRKSYDALGSAPFWIVYSYMALKNIGIQYRVERILAHRITSWPLIEVWPRFRHRENRILTFALFGEDSTNYAIGDFDEVCDLIFKIRLAGHSMASFNMPYRNDPEVYPQGSTLQPYRFELIEAMQNATYSVGLEEPK